MRYATWLWAVLLVLPLKVGVANGAALRLTMDEAVARARASGLDVAASRTEVDIARANLERDSAWLPANPYFTAGAQTTSRTGTSSNYNLLLSQEFEIAGQRARRMEIATQDIEKTTWDTKLTEQTLAATVKTTFVQGLASLDRVTLAQKAFALATELANRSEERRALSDVQRVELNLARMQAVRARREVAAAEQRRDLALAALRRQLGLAPDQEIDLVGPLRSDVAEIAAGPELLERALRQRPDLVALRYTLQHANLQIELAKREAIPNVTLSATVSQFEGDHLVGGDVSVPLPIFRSRVSEVHSATAAREHADLLMKSLEQEITKDVLDARHACSVAADDIQAFQRELVPRSEENLELERHLYERNQVMLSDLVNIEADLFTVRREYVDALETYNTALVELERIVAGGIAP